jgi:hypothetical protein
MFYRLHITSMKAIISAALIATPVAGLSAAAEAPSGKKEGPSISISEIPKVRILQNDDLLDKVRDHLEYLSQKMRAQHKGTSEPAGSVDAEDDKGDKSTRKVRPSSAQVEGH